jgi:hypothetical protein|tara:strand:+ start:112 stop:231 length:120 start_codon:yes stop_codon:yes gene_type:complete
MEALYAGLAAWTVEIIIACIMLIGLKREENKVIKRRKSK